MEGWKMEQKLNRLQSWSWESIENVYIILGKQLKEYELVNSRIAVPKMVNINFSYHDNDFITRFWYDIDKIDWHLKILDAEISRRNRLVGVIG